MKCDPHIREPRAQVIFRHTSAALRGTGLKPQMLADLIADQYQAQVAEDERIVEFHVGTTADSIVKAQKANLQLMSHFRSGIVKLPVDLEESWVACLPEPHRSDCERELAQRYGFVGARASGMPASDARALCVAEVSIEFGQLVQKIAAVNTTDGLTHTDLPDLVRAEKEAADLLAAVTSMHLNLQAAISSVSIDQGRPAQ